MSDPVYVPGYGYVGGEDNTGSARGSGSSRPSPAPSGRERRTWFGTDAVARARTNARTTDGSQRGKYGNPDGDPSQDPMVTGPKVRPDLALPISYRPPIQNPWRGADGQEREIGTLPLLYRIQDAGDLREAYWGDPESRAIIQAAARIYYRDYSNYSDQWAEGWWQKDIMGAAQNPGATPPWEMLQQIFTDGAKAESAPDGSSPSSSYSGGGGGYGGGGGGGSVSLTNPTSARGLLMQTMQSVLGRNPSNDEYKTFLQVLNEAEMANPNTASFEGGTTVGSGGVDPGVLALEFAQDQEDYTERQGDNYFRTFMQALAGGV
jgi:hypothetical protein